MRPVSCRRVQLPSEAGVGASRPPVPARRSCGHGASAVVLSHRPVGKIRHTLQEDWNRRANLTAGDVAPVIVSAAPLLLCVNPSQAALPLEAYQELAEQFQHNTPLEVACFTLLLFTTAYTAAFTGRFLLSCFPRLERQRQEPPWAVLTQSTDPILEPMRLVFAENKTKLEGMDVAAVVALSILSIFHELSFGAMGGLLLKGIPYALVQDYAEILLLTQRVFLLPMYLLIVFRFINYI